MAQMGPDGQVVTLANGESGQVVVPTTTQTSTTGVAEAGEAGDGGSQVYVVSSSGVHPVNREDGVKEEDGQNQGFATTEAMEWERADVNSQQEKVKF